MFIDRAKIHVRAGSGGRGCESYYRDKFQRNGIPNGGDGGKGADIIVRAERNLFTLLDFKYNRHFHGAHGGHGSSKNQKGKDAAAVLIRVPLGTVVADAGINCILRDLQDDGQELVVAYGGRGGRGNSNNREASLGEPGEEKDLLLDLKLIADAGIVGFPNAGKSTLIAGISNAHPKIAAYPFTTKSPALGVVKAGEKDFVIADIPGLIEGASQGKGLGHNFLRHIERTKVIIHLIDISGFEGRDPLEDYRAVNRELKEYNELLLKKPQVIAANKMDLPGSEANLKRFKAAVKKRVFPVSALERRGLEELIEAITKKL